MEFNAESAKAIARLIITIVSAVATTFGWVFDADLWLNILLSVVAVIFLVYAWWKNENLTSAAQEAQIILNEIKQTEKGA